MYPRIYKEFAPDRHLRQHIKCYWIFEKTFKDGEFERVFPDSSYELVYSNVTYYVNNRPLPRFFIVGQHSKPIDFFATDLVRLWCVRFYPWGLTPFSKVDTLVSRDWEHAESILDKNIFKDLNEIFQKITEENSVSTLDEYFLKLLLDKQFPKAFLKKATQRLLAEKGNIKVQELADFCFISRRQLERGIKQITGHTPHELSLRFRFEKTRDDIMHNPDIPLAFLALENGYTDQSYLVHDFKKYANMTPAEYAQMFRQLKPQMQNPKNVVFLQDFEEKE